MQLVGALSDTVPGEGGRAPFVPTHTRPLSAGGPGRSPTHPDGVDVGLVSRERLTADSLPYVPQLPEEKHRPGQTQVNGGSQHHRRVTGGHHRMVTRGHRSQATGHRTVTRTQVTG